MDIELDNGGDDRRGVRHRPAIQLNSLSHVLALTVRAVPGLVDLVSPEDATTLHEPCVLSSFVV